MFWIGPSTCIAGTSSLKNEVQVNVEDESFASVDRNDRDQGGEEIEGDDASPWVNKTVDRPLPSLSDAEHDFGLLEDTVHRGIIFRSWTQKRFVRSCRRSWGGEERHGMPFRFVPHINVRKALADVDCGKVSRRGTNQSLRRLKFHQTLLPGVRTVRPS